MSRKNDRERQKRQQRKREKREREKRERQRAARRAAAGTGSRGSAWLPASRPRDAAVSVCVDACRSLFAGAGRLDADERQAVLHAARRAGDAWPRLILALEAFLYDDSEWSLTQAQVESFRSAFEREDADQAFERLQALALTSEPDAGAALAAARSEDCAQRAALAFHALRGCLDAPTRDPARALAAVATEMDRHDAGSALKKGYRNLLAAAVSAVRAPAPSRSEAAGALARDGLRILERHAAQQSATAWWQCGRVFLAEVFDRLATGGSAAALAQHPALVTQLFDAPRALVWLAQHGAAPAALRSVPYQTQAEAWLGFLGRQVDPRSLSFDDRLRFEIAQLKLQQARATRSRAGGGTAAGVQHREWLAAFGELRSLLAHGVPPQSRALPALLEQPLVDFFVVAVTGLHCEDAALPVTEDLRRRHPEDFRLGCLYATAVLLRGDRRKLQVLAGCAPRAHVDAELFARCATIWARLPDGARAAAAARPLLFDSLDREHRKQCLSQLARRALLSATSPDAYRRELRGLLPYFERDNFIYRELRDNAALESGLVFLATMMAPLHGARLELSESQSRQWVSYACEIAQQSSLGAELAVHHLRTPSSAFTLAPDVAEAARASLHEFRPKTATPPGMGRASAADAARETARRPRRGRRARSAKVRSDSTRQPELFDAVDP